MKHTKGFLKLVDEAKTRIHEVSVAETLQRLSSTDPARLIDVREDHEWEAAHAQANWMRGGKGNAGGELNRLGKS